MLSKTQVAFEAERANIRKLEIFKPDVKAPGGGKTYRALKKEANVRLAALAGRIAALRSEVANLKHKMQMMCPPWSYPTGQPPHQPLFRRAGRGRLPSGRMTSLDPGAE